jgi:hypothetical protein
MVGMAVLDASSLLLIAVFPFSPKRCHVVFTTNIRVNRIARRLVGNIGKTVEGDA